MDPNMKQLQGTLIDIETDAEQLLLARHQLVENDRMRNANREALTALRKKAKTTKTSVPSPFEIVMKEMEGTSAKQLVKEICSTCGNHDPKEHTWLMFPGSDILARVPFHVAHTVLDKEYLVVGPFPLQRSKLDLFLFEPSINYIYACVPEWKHTRRRTSWFKLVAWRSHVRSRASRLRDQEAAKLCQGEIVCDLRERRPRGQDQPGHREIPRQPCR
uniref:P53 and DNA damage-regulated protein 1 n=1 Tax=Triticum urartu TaxID=4572 RepID=A0A8R7PAB4_TRIUA